ncbi:MAG TPA: flagellar basal body P-ring formation chaperone FlgA [Opitutaceae bacterium]|nr:flagellar basal body P-ring formation chaperone FlgA [Opitutaceae bacterium]
MARFVPFFFFLLSLVSASMVRAQTTPVPVVDELRERLLLSLAGDLSTHFNADGELQLDLLRPWSLPSTATMANGKEWSVKVIEYPSVLASSLLLRVRVAGPAGFVRDDTVQCRAQLWRDAWVVQAPADRGSAFDPSQCDIRRIDALRDREAVPASFVNSSDWSFLRPTPAGKLLTWRDLARRALVRKGDVIEVAAIDGPLQITLKAMAMQDGGKGETVRVRNLESRREFAALVVSENRAQVRF